MPFARYPIKLARKTYLGQDPARRARAAARNERAAVIEGAINARLVGQVPPVLDVDYHEIAAETGYTFDQVVDHCFAVCGGHNGFRVARRDLSDADAFRLATSAPPDDDS